MLDEKDEELEKAETDSEKAWDRASEAIDKVDELGESEEEN